MNELSQQQKEYLENLFGDRVNFDPRERRFYAYDVGTMPRMMKRFSGSNLPAGIVQPSSQEELVKLMGWAQANKIPLTPRGKATSGYGGAVPTRAGLVVESNRMKKILAINVEERTVTVQAGVVWEKLEAELNTKRFDFECLPHQCPSLNCSWVAGCRRSRYRQLPGRLFPG